ncbi:MAG: hypothetical protein QNJ38_18935 [Prochloraceae cyanobacterium]|nr:hypothetical protein [Prochloraceae cyanobacterium]
MSELLDRAMALLKELPESQQNEIAAIIILEELEDKRSSGFGSVRTQIMTSYSLSCNRSKLL